MLKLWSNKFMQLMFVFLMTSAILFGCADVQTDSVNAIPSQNSADNTVVESLSPEIVPLKTYLCDDDWNEFKGGCSWYCGAKVPIMTASSELVSQGDNSYSAQNAHDFNLNTAWCEGAKNDGIGECLTMTVDGNQEQLSITHFEIVNGYVKSEKLWHENSRVKKIRVMLNDTFFKTLNLEDSMEMQRFDIGVIPLNQDEDLVFDFIIEEVYPGDKYHDTAITELELDGLGSH